MKERSLDQGSLADATARSYDGCASLEVEYPMQSPSQSPGRGREGAASEADDRDALDSEVLYRQYWRTVFSYVLNRIGGNRDEAEDITAETFVAAHKSLPRFRRECSPRVWLLSIARQRIALAARHTELVRSLEVLQADLSERELELFELVLAADVEQLPENKVLAAEASEVMRRLLGELTDLQREALLLQTYHGLSVQEIAGVLGRTPTSVNSLLERARARIFRMGRGYFKG